MRLIFFDKAVDVIIYAVSGGIITSALVLRTQLRFQLEKRAQEEIKTDATEEIAKLERDLKFLDVDARIQKADSIERRRDAILRMLDLHKNDLKKVNRILRSMGG